MRNVINICLRSTQRGWRPYENKTTTLTRLTTVECGSWPKHGFPWLCQPPPHSPLLFFFLFSSHSLSIIKSHPLFLFTYFPSLSFCILCCALCFLSYLPFSLCYASSFLSASVLVCLILCPSCPRLLCIFSSLLLLPLFLHSKHHSSLSITDKMWVLPAADWQNTVRKRSFFKLMFQALTSTSIWPECP